MATARSAWGIDMGNRALKAIKLVRDNDRFRIEDYEIIEHEQILSNAGDNREALVQAALNAFVEKRKLKNAIVGVGVSGQQSFARFIKLPPVEPKKIPEIVKFEAIQQIPFPLDDVEWAYQLFQAPESPDVEVGIFAMKRELVNKQIEYFTNLGLNVQIVQMLPLAVYNAMYYDDRLNETSMFMDAGAEHTDLIIADAQSVWLRTLPIGGNNFTEALAKSFKLSFAKAEDLKRNAATSKYAKQIFQAMRSVFADLVSEIQRSMGFYASVHREARISKIVALGSTFQLPGLQKYLQQNLQLPAEKLDSFKALPPTDSKMAASMQEGVISLAAAYGLALQAMGEGKISSSLLPQSIKTAKLWQEKTKWFGAAAAMFVAGAIGAAASTYLSNVSYDQKSAVRSDIQEIYGKAKGLADDWRGSVETKGEEDTQKLMQLRSVLEYRNLWTSIVADIAAAVPPAGDLESLKKISREDRKQITLHNISSRYKEDVKPALNAKDTTEFASFADTGAPDQSTGPGRGPSPDTGTPTPTPTEGGTEAAAVATQRGFLITIVGTTPNKGSATYVDSEFVRKLAEKTVEAQIQANKKYHIARAEIVQMGPRVPTAATPGGDLTADQDINEDPDTGAELVQAPPGGVRPGPADDMRGGGGGGGRGIISPLGGRGGEAQPAPRTDFRGSSADPNAPKGPPKDRYFPEETLDKDWKFKVLAVVVLDPAVQPKTEEAKPAEETK